MPIETLLVTGAAGGLGRALRPLLPGRVGRIVWSDLAAMDPPADARESCIPCDLTDADAVADLCRGVDAILHLGGQSTEAEWPRVLAANFHGAVNLYEGARLAGVDRVLFASSNHAIGLWRRRDRLDHHAEPRPDGRYGLSKAFGEDLARLYAYKFGVRGFCMRIGSCFPRPINERMLATWMSYADFVRLIEVGLSADYVYEIVYGVSANTRGWWDNANAARLGYAPQDDAERFAAEVGHLVAENPLEAEFQGGGFVPPDFVGTAERIP